MANIVVPELGESVVEARVARWLKKAGDRVEVGEYQFEVLQIGENTIRTVRARRVATPAA